MTGRECCHERLWEIILPPAGRRRCPLREHSPRSAAPPAANALLLLRTAFGALAEKMPALTFTHPTKYGKGSREW